jgi:predicted nucleotidyltransferase
VRDTALPASDIDLLVEFEPGKKTFDNFMNLSFYLEELLGRKVDILTPQSLSKYIGPHILREAEYVF